MFPSVRTPSTSISNSLIFLARTSSFWENFGIGVVVTLAAKFGMPPGGCAPAGLCLEHLSRPQIVYMQSALEPAFGIDNQQGGDLASLHQAERLGGQLFAVDSDGEARHAILRRQTQRPGPFALQHAAQIA